MERKHRLDDDVEHGNKRLKISQKNDMKIQNTDRIEKNGDDYDNGDSVPQFTVQFFEVQTSTPITQNGIVKSAHQMTDVVKATFPPTSPICATTQSTSSNSENASSVSSLITNEQTNGTENTNNSKADNVNVLQNESSDKVSCEKNVEINTEQCQITECVDIVVAAKNDVNNQEINLVPPQHEEQAEKPCHNSWQYDSSNFLNSFLRVSDLKGHADNINAVVVDGDIILSASSDTTIKMWDSTTKEEIRNFQGHTGSITALVLLTSKQSISLATKMNFQENSRILISASLDCSVRLWDISSGALLSSFYTYNGITSLEYLDASHRVALSTDGGKLEIWDVLTSKVKHSIMAHLDAITCLKVDGCYIYTASSDGLMKVWRLDDEDDEINVIYTRRRMQRSQNPGKLEPSNWQCLDFLNEQIYLGDNTPYLKLLNWQEGHIRELSSQIQQSDITEAVCIKEDILINSYFHTSSNSGGINVWRLPEMKYICTMSGKLNRISSLAMTVTEDKILRIISGGTELLVWDFICDRPVSEEKNAMFICQDLRSLGLSLEEKASTEESSGSSMSLASDANEKAKEKQWCSVM